MQAIETFLMNVFGQIFSRAKYSATSTAERKVRESLEKGYDRAINSKDRQNPANNR